MPTNFNTKIQWALLSAHKSQKSLQNRHTYTHAHLHLYLYRKKQKRVVFLCLNKSAKAHFYLSMPADSYFQQAKTCYQRNFEHITTYFTTSGERNHLLRTMQLSASQPLHQTHVAVKCLRLPLPAPDLQTWGPCLIHTCDRSHGQGPFNDGICIIGKYLGPTTLKGSTKDCCKIFWTYVTQSISNVLCTVSIRLSVFPLNINIT